MLKTTVYVCTVRGVYNSGLRVCACVSSSAVCQCTVGVVSVQPRPPLETVARSSSHRYHTPAHRNSHQAHSTQQTAHNKQHTTSQHIPHNK